MKRFTLRDGSSVRNVTIDKANLVRKNHLGALGKGAPGPLGEEDMGTVHTSFEAFV